MADDEEDFDYTFDDGDEEEEAKKSSEEKKEDDEEQKDGGEEKDEGKGDDDYDEQKSQKDDKSKGEDNDLETLQDALREATEENERLKKEIEDKDEELEEARVSKEEGGDNVSSYTKLMGNFINFAKANSLGCTASNANDVTEDMAIAILSEAQAKLKKSAGRPVTTTTSANCDEGELVQRVANLEEELRLALGAAEDIRALKAKAVQLVERIRLEKEDRLKSETEVRSYVKKVEMLSDHIEKLMIHLKHEAAAKIKAIDQLRGSEKRNEILKEDLDLLNRKTTAKERLIAELREGSKILEDQLRLMDEKYLELRTKLDYAREVAGKKVRNAQKTASELRVKFALAGNQKLLDHIPLPDIQDGNSYDMGFDSQSMSVESQTRTRRKTKKKDKRNSKNHHLSQDTEQSTERVLDKIRRLRGGEQDWDETKCRNLANTR